MIKRTHPLAMFPAGTAAIGGRLEHIEAGGIRYCIRVWFDTPTPGMGTIAFIDDASNIVNHEIMNRILVCADEMRWAIARMLQPHAPELLAKHMER